jgi:PII-like signaling protein
LGVLLLVGKSRKGLTFESFTHFMELPRDALLLRIFLGEADELGGEPVYQKIVLKAREMNLAGATVLRGPLGFGRSSHLHAKATLRVSKDLPIVIEIVDSEEKIQEFLAAVEGIVGAGLITMEKVQAIFYKASPPMARGR